MKLRILGQSVILGIILVANALVLILQNKYWYPIGLDNFFPYSSLLYEMVREWLGLFRIARIALLVLTAFLAVLSWRTRLNSEKRDWLPLWLVFCSVMLSLPPIFLLPHILLLSACFLGTLLLIVFRLTSGEKMSFRNGNLPSLLHMTLSDIGVFFLIVQLMRFAPAPFVVD